MKVFLTGATGFVGRHLLEALIERGDTVHILVQPGEDTSWLALQGVQIFLGDLSNRAVLEDAVNGVDCVLHCAARTGPWGPQAEYDRINVQGPKVLVDVSLTAGVQRIVHVSSVTVHGADVQGSADETTPLCGGPDPYSRSKVAGELLLKEIIRTRGAPLTIVRPGLVYGPRDLGSFGRFTSLINAGKMVVIGSGNNHLPLIYVTDVVQGILLASVAEHVVGREYILVNDEPVTQSNYLNTIASVLGVPPPSRHIPYRLSLGIAAAAETAGHLLHWKQPPPLTRFGVQVLGGENRFVIDRARLELGFNPRINLAEGVRKGIEWYRTTQQ